MTLIMIVLPFAEVRKHERESNILYLDRDGSIILRVLTSHLVFVLVSTLCVLMCLPIPPAASFALLTVSSVSSR
jgi:hypothetical protein